MNNITGTLKKIGETKEYGSNGFTKREFVIETDEKYPQEVKLELYKDDCSLLDSFKIGGSLDATFNIKGNEYKGNYYVNLQAWKISHVGESTSEVQEASPATEKKTNTPKKQKEPELQEEDLTENISELADAPF
tara:strand:- start:209 stop:610 length:402 start_codon:yes stop_codon:yes gene_type:complete